MYLVLPNTNSRTPVRATDLSTGPRSPSYPADAKDLSTWARTTNDHCFFSMLEGSTPTLRISKTENHVRTAYGIVVTYKDDKRTPEQALEWLLERSDNQPLPTHIFRAGNSICMEYRFGKPVSLSGNRQWSELAKIIRQRLELAKRYFGIDHKAMESAESVYDVGPGPWLKVLGSEPLSFEAMYTWHLESHDESIQHTAGSEPVIDIGTLAAEAEARFPGQWSGEFAVGARGPMFWSPSLSPDKKCCTIRANGVHHYVSGGQTFYSWQAIFGTEFTDKFGSQVTGPLFNNTFYEVGNKKFWTKNDESGIYEQGGIAEFKRMAQKMGVSAKAGKREQSPADTLVTSIEMDRRVDAVYPMPFFPPMHFKYGTMRILNTFRYNHTLPGAPLTGEKKSWGQLEGTDFGFPHIFCWVNAIGSQDLPSGLDKDVQLVTLIRWIQQAYKAILYQAQDISQAVILAGSMNAGKTFFVRKLLAKLLGGFADGDSFIVKGEKFSASAVSEPICSIDDVTITGGAKQREAITGRLKAFVAAGCVEYEQKFCPRVTLPLSARIVFACNNDDVSARILPDTDQGTRDKFHLFRSFGNPKWTSAFVADIAVNERVLLEELPAFARWLLEWECPEHINGRLLLGTAEARRFGVATYHHPSLLHATEQQGSSPLVLETLDLAFKNLDLKDENGAKKPRTEWEGTTLELHQLMKVTLSDAGSSELMRELDHRRLGTWLGVWSKGNKGVTRVNAPSARTATWRLDRAMLYGPSPEEGVVG